MRVRHRGTFTAPPDVVFEAFTTPGVVVAKYEHLGHSNVRIVEFEQRFGTVTIRSRREVPTEVPGFASRFFRPSTVVEENIQWDSSQPDGSRSGTWQVTARGVPVTAGGVQRLVPTADGATERVVEGEVVCPMPGEQARLAEVVLAGIERTLADEDLFIERWLSSQRSELR